MNTNKKSCSQFGDQRSGESRMRSSGFGNGSRGNGGRGNGGRMDQRGFNASTNTSTESEFMENEHAEQRAAHLAQIRADIAASPRGLLTSEERSDLLLMREEEKIARDVYIRLYERWGIRPFQNITGSEQVHMDAMLALLEHYGESDPVRGLAVGQFYRADLQALYEDLINQGLRSEADAVRVGLLIEELDIADLQKVARRTNKPEILAVYAELERGSRNHLRAFYRWKQKLSIDYVPQHLSSAEFERTGLSAHEMCH